MTAGIKMERDKTAPDPPPLRNLILSPTRNLDDHRPHAAPRPPTPMRLPNLLQPINRLNRHLHLPPRQHSKQVLQIRPKRAPIPRDPIHRRPLLPRPQPAHQTPRVQLRNRPNHRRGFALLLPLPHLPAQRPQIVAVPHQNAPVRLRLEDRINLVPALEAQRVEDGVHAASLQRLHRIDPPFVPVGEQRHLPLPLPHPQSPPHLLMLALTRGPVHGTGTSAQGQHRERVPNRAADAVDEDGLAGEEVRGVVD